MQFLYPDSKYMPYYIVGGVLIAISTVAIVLMGSGNPLIRVRATSDDGGGTVYLGDDASRRSSEKTPEREDTVDKGRTLPRLTVESESYYVYESIQVTFELEQGKFSQYTHRILKCQIEQGTEDCRGSTPVPPLLNKGTLTFSASTSGTYIFIYYLDENATKEVARTRTINVYDRQEEVPFRLAPDAPNLHSGDQLGEGEVDISSPTELRAPTSEQAELQDKHMRQQLPEPKRSWFRRLWDFFTAPRG